MDLYAPATPCTIRFGNTQTQYKGILKGEYFIADFFKEMIRLGKDPDVAMKNAIRVVHMMADGTSPEQPVVSKVKKGEETKQESFKLDESL